MILGRHRKPAPRLAAELDDTELGTVCRRLTARGSGHTRVLVSPSCSACSTTPVPTGTGHTDSRS